MAFGSVNAGGGASGKLIEQIRQAINNVSVDLKKIIQEHTNADNPHNITPAKIRAVPETRKINNKPLTGDVTLNAGDVGAAPASHTHSAADLTGKIYHAGTSAPTNKNLLWIDTNANTGGLKYHNGSAWVLVASNYS